MGDPSEPRAGVSRRTILAVSLGAAGLVIAAPIAFVSGLLRAGDSRFAAGTVVGEIDLGGLTPDEALARFDERWAAYLANPVVFELNGRVWRPSAAEIGLAVDYRSALREAFALGRSGGIAQQLAGRFESTDALFEPSVSFDAAQLRAYLGGIAAAFDQPAVDADLDVPPEGNLRLRPSQPGRVVDIDGAIRELGAPTQPAAPGRVIRLRFREDQPAFITTKAEAAIAELQRMIAGPVWLMHGSRGWTIEPQDLRAALRADRRNGEFVPTFEFTRFNDLFQTIERTLTAEPKQTVFEYDDSSDRVLAFEPGHTGQRVDRPALERAILQRVTGEGDRRLEIPVILLNKEFDLSANPLGVKDLLATGSSIYHGSPSYRLTNIAVGAEKLDGQVVRPGEIFSFNERIGDFTLAEGWVEGSIIVADKTERGIGGGICQVSTTLFRAVINAGLAIEERWPHLYRVRYYEMGDFPIGIDATIYVPGVDLKFRNDFESPVLIRSIADTRLGTLDFEIWGVDDGRRVELVDHTLQNWVEPPPEQAIIDASEAPDFEKQVEWAKRGVFASFTRLITYADGTQKRSTFKSSFVAWPDRFVVGIDVAKARFPADYNEWVDENPEEAARWGVGRVPGVSADPDAPAG